MQWRFLRFLPFMGRLLTLRSESRSYYKYFLTAPSSAAAPAE